jgi:hypothetical protein
MTAVAGEIELVDFNAAVVALIERVSRAYPRVDLASTRRPRLARSGRVPCRHERVLPARRASPRCSSASRTRPFARDWAGCGPVGGIHSQPTPSTG